MICTHHSLDELHSLVAYLVDDSWDIHHILLTHLLQSLVYCDECPRPTYSSTAGEGGGYTQEIVEAIDTCSGP